VNYLKQYEYIAAVAEFRSITIAAERLGIAQSALSRYIKNLEDKLGVQLLDRSIDPIALTPAGIYFLEIGRKMLALDQGMMLHIKDMQMTDYTTIRVGIGSSRAPYILPVILELFRKHDTQTNIVVFELTTDEIKQRLLKSEIDIAISVYDTDSSHIESIKLFDERILLCENSKKPNNCPIFPGEGQLLREVMNNVVAHNNSYSSNYIEVQNTETAVALVKAGLGFTVVPSYFEEFSFGDGLAYSELPNSFSKKERSISLMYRKDKTLKKEELFFLECAKEALS
jgi:DNA-binding transcriptional LysR family regulator